MLVAKHCRDDTARTASGGGYDDFTRGVLLAHSKGVRAYETVFFGLRSFVNVALLIENSGSALGVETSREHTACFETLFDCVFHRFPNLCKVGADFSSLKAFHVLGNGDFLFVAIFANLLESVMRVYVLGLYRTFALDLDCTSAHAVNAPRVYYFAV